VLDLRAAPLEGRSLSQALALFVERWRRRRARTWTTRR
jgi:hypothetical protein